MLEFKLPILGKKELLKINMICRSFLPSAKMILCWKRIRQDDDTEIRFFKPANYYYHNLSMSTFNFFSDAKK